MGEAEVSRIELLLTQLMAALGERCPQRQRDINELQRDMDEAFKDIRALKMTMARWSILSALATAALTSGVVKFLVG